MAQTYQPLQPNQAPAFGTSGQAVADLQHNYNVQNAGLPGWTPLAEDGQYGPLTQAGVAWKPANPGIVSGTAANNSLMQDGNKLDQMTNGQDPYMEYLQKKASGLMNGDSQPGADEKNAAATSFKEQQKTTNDYAAYKAGLETLGIQSGLAQVAPSLQADRMINAANSETQKLADIQDKEDFAIAKAKQARLDNDAKTLKDTLSEINQLKKDKAAELENQLNRQSKEFDIAMQHAPAAYATYASLPPDKQEAFILEHSNELGISPKNYVDALVAWHTKQKSSGTGGGYTALETRKLREAGIDPSNTKMADNYLYGANKGVKPVTFSQASIDSGDLTKGKVWDLALALGVPRSRNLSKQNEIDTLFSDTKKSSYIQSMLDEGYTLDEIISQNS